VAGRQALTIGTCRKKRDYGYRSSTMMVICVAYGFAEEALDPSGGKISSVVIIQCQDSFP
jgi:hypothetical protein